MLVVIGTAAGAVLLLAVGWLLALVARRHLPPATHTPLHRAFNAPRRRLARPPTAPPHAAPYERPSGRSVAVQDALEAMLGRLCETYVDSWYAPLVASPATTTAAAPAGPATVAAAASPSPPPPPAMPDGTVAARGEGEAETEGAGRMAGVGAPVTAAAARVAAATTTTVTPGPRTAVEVAEMDAAVKVLLLRVADAAQARLASADLQAFLLGDVVGLCTRHIRAVRLKDPTRFPSHPCLASADTELAYMRRAADALLALLAPPAEVANAGLRALLREIVAQSVLLPLVNNLSDPDWINQMLVWHLDTMEEARGLRSRAYLYADTFTAFCNMIKTSDNLETLHDMRQHVIAEILQVQQILDFKALEAQGRADRATRALVMDTAKAAHLKSYNLSKYLNQCNVAKAACEKRIFSLGGPDYRLTSHLEELPTGLGNLHRSASSRSSQTHRARASHRRVGQLLSSAAEEDSAAHLNASSSTPGGPTLTDVLEDGLGSKFFLDYVTQQHLEHNLRFWSAVRSFRKALEAEHRISLSSVLYVASTYETAKASGKVLKVEQGTQEELQACITRLETMQDEADVIIEDHTLVRPFLQAQVQIQRFLEENVFHTFLLSDQYRSFLSDTVQERDHRHHRQRAQALRAVAHSASASQPASRPPTREGTNTPHSKPPSTLTSPSATSSAVPPLFELDSSETSSKPGVAASMSSDSLQSQNVVSGDTGAAAAAATGTWSLFGSGSKGGAATRSRASLDACGQDLSGPIDGSYAVIDEMSEPASREQTDEDEEDEDEFHDATDTPTVTASASNESLNYDQGAAIKDLRALIHRKQGEVMALRMEGSDAALAEAEAELETLYTRQSQLERHLSLTQHYWEHQGSWRADVEHVDLIALEDDAAPPEEVFVIVVHCSLFGTAASPAPASPTDRQARDGWLVIRTWAEVMDLHRELRAYGCDVPRSVKLPARPWRSTQRARDAYAKRAKDALQTYLQRVLADTRAQESQCLFAFLCNSPDHLRLQHSSLEHRRRRAKAALRRVRRGGSLAPRAVEQEVYKIEAAAEEASTAAKAAAAAKEASEAGSDGAATGATAIATDTSSTATVSSPEAREQRGEARDANEYANVGANGDANASAASPAVEDSDSETEDDNDVDDDDEEEEDDDARDSAAKPLYGLVSELFELQGVFQWLRRTVVGFVRLTYGKTINRTLSESVDWLFYDAQLLLYISSLAESLFPREVPPVEVRTPALRAATRDNAERCFMANLPPVLASLVGQRNLRSGAARLFNSLQNAHMNRHLMVCLLELLLVRLLPELSERDLDDSFVPMDAVRRHEHAVELALALQEAQVMAMAQAQDNATDNGSGEADAAHEGAGAATRGSSAAEAGRGAAAVQAAR